MCQLAMAVNAVVATRGQSRRSRLAELERIAQIIERTQHRNRKAAQSHRRRTIQRLAHHGIHLDFCRCCLPEGKPAL